MDSHFAQLRAAYDLTVTQFRQGINPLDAVPEEFTSSDAYQAMMGEMGESNSGAPAVRAFLDPQPGMRLLDAGCSANLANYRLDRWPSRYYGVDISPALIAAMQGFVAQEGVDIGGLWVAELAALPFDDAFFDLAAVIGVLEYFPLEYVARALRELHRVLKPGAKLALDLPNPAHPHLPTMRQLEAYLGRPHPSDPLSREAFESLLAPLFTIERVDDTRVMFNYHLRNG